jgi:hypothetical protein
VRVRARIATIALAAAACAVCPAVASADTGPLLPTSDPFYAYTGSTPLASIAPGTILKQRTIAVNGDVTPTTATQVLYRTTGELGQPTVTVATIIRPPVPMSTKIISYQMAYDALGPECDPSYTLQGGNRAGATTNTAEQQLVSAYTMAGDTAVIPDYEGEALDWAAGQESGYNTLDGIRAAENLLKVPPASTPVAMVGYSGGSIATEFASELAPTYAPDLHIVGVAEGGIPVDMAHNLAYINGSKDWSGVIPAVLVALSRAFNLDIAKYSSPYGLKIASQVGGECINSFLGAFPGLTYQQLLAPQWQDIYSIPNVAAITDKLIMGRTGTPQEPLFMGVGNADGTGDGVMIAADVEALAHEYCERGVPVQFNVYKGDDHTAAAIPFEVGALTFLTARLNGLAVGNGCSSIGVGNALTPVPLPPALALRNLKRTARSVVVYVQTNTGTLSDVLVQLRRGHRLVASRTVATVSTARHKLTLRAKAPGRYTITASWQGVAEATRTLRIRARKR